MAIELTIITSLASDLNKELSIDSKGVLKKVASANLYKGEAKVVSISTMIDLNRLINSIKSNEALILGVPMLNNELLSHSKIGSKKYINENALKAYIQRSKDYFKYRLGVPALMLFDIDDLTDSPQEVWHKLCSIDERLKECGYVVSHSTTSFIYDSNGKQLKGQGGLHFYIPVKDGADIERYGKAFSKKAWLYNFGLIKVAKNGSLLVRQIIDDTVFKPERIVFEAAAKLSGGIVQKKPPVSSVEGFFLDTSTFRLTPHQEKEIEAIIEIAKVSKRSDSEIKKTVYIREKAEEIHSLKGISIEQAKQDLKKSLEDDVLYGSNLLKFDDYGEKTVNEVLDNISFYTEKTLSDPIEPESGRNKAKLYFRNKKAYIYTFAHGGRKYFLEKGEKHKPENLYNSNTIGFDKPLSKLAKRFIYNIKNFIHFALADPNLDPDTISKRILIALVADRNSGNDQIAFENFIYRRRIIDLVHYTHIDNVEKIMKFGIIPRSYLEIEPIKSHMQPVYSELSNTIKDANSLSISHPDFLKLNKNKDYKTEWVVLKISPKIMILHNCSFLCNGHKNNGVDFAEMLFDNENLRNDLGLYSYETTDPRAVVIEYSVIPPSFIEEIHICNSKYYSYLQKKAGKSNIEVKIDEKFFKKRHDYLYWESMR